MRRDVSVAGRRMQFAVDRFQVLGAVAAVQVDVSLQSSHVDLAVTSPQVDPALARHLDNDVHSALAPIDADAVMWVVHADFDRIAILTFLHANTVPADLVARGG